MNFAIVFLGAGLGGALRHRVNHWALRYASVGFPVGTLAINALGSLVMGLVVGWLAARGEASATLRLFLTTGVLGGFTTFSSFSLEAYTLLRTQQWLAALLYVAGSLLLGLLALAVGIVLARRL